MGYGRSDVKRSIYALCIEQFDELGEISQRPRQAIELVDDDDVNLSRADVLQQRLQVGPVGRPTGVSAVVISGPDQFERFSLSVRPV